MFHSELSFLELHRPLQLHGIIYSTNFDMGVMGSAYYDAGADANYGGDFSPWNNGWGLRNDNVDIQLSNDSLSNGFHVGWTETRKADASFNSLL